MSYSYEFKIDYSEPIIVTLAWEPDAHSDFWFQKCFKDVVSLQEWWHKNGYLFCVVVIEARVGSRLVSFSDLLLTCK